MNLYLFNDNDSAATYGIGTYLNELTHALEGTVIHIHIVHLHSVRSEFEIVKTNQVEHWYIPEVRNQNTFSGAVRKVEDYCRNVIYLFRLHIKDTRELVFHFNFNLCQLLAKELKTVFDCKTVTTVHFLKWLSELQGNLFKLQAIKSKPKNQMTAFENSIYATDKYESLLFNEVDRVIALSLNMKNLLFTEYQLDSNKISVIPNGLEDTNPVPVVGKDVLRRKWGISEKEFLILFVGRLHAAKGLIFLIEAFRKVLEKIPDCRLMIVGGGNFEPYLQASKSICTKITFTGLVEKKELHELYQIADIGILPSLTEQCSYVIMEMMMSRLPIIITSASGLAEMAEDGISSLQVPVIVSPDREEIDTGLLADKILYLLEYPENAEWLGENARKRYEKRYSMEVFRKNMLNFYHSLYE